jgi:protein tyrosine phosphatase
MMEVETLRMHKFSDGSKVELKEFIDHDDSRSFSVTMSNIGGIVALIHCSTMVGATAIFRTITNDAICVS